MRSLSSAVVACVTVVFSASPAFAAWGVSQWGSMLWGEATPAVPALEAAGVALLIASLVAAAAWRLRRRSVAASLLLLGLVLPLAGGALNVILPNTFLNGAAADADQVNANFSTILAAANDTLVASGSEGSAVVTHTFTNGQVAEATEVNTNFGDLKNAIETAWGGIPTVTQNVCNAAGGTWESEACTAAPDVTSNDAAICAAAGGTWIGGGVCTPAPGADYWSLGFYPACMSAGHCTSLGGISDSNSCLLLSSAGTDHEIDIPLCN